MLIADSDAKYAESLLSERAHPYFPIEHVKTGADAQKVIANQEITLSGVFINPHIQGASWVSIVKAAHQHRPATPIYLLTNDEDTASELDFVDLKKLGVREQLKKPISYPELVKILSPVIMIFEENENLNQARNLEEAQMDGAYVPIRSEDFLSGSKSVFDVFVRLGKHKYVKLLHAHDAFEPRRLKKYLEKGVKYFYIRKEVQDIYMNYCDQIATAILKNSKVSTEFKMAQTLNFGEEVLKNMTENGVRDTSLAYSTKFISNLREIVDQIKVNSPSTMLRKYVEQAILYEHGIATSMIAGVLAQTLKIRGENPVQVVGLAAMFHDLALAEMPTALYLEDEAYMTEDERVIFRNHPAIAAAELSKHRLIPEAAIQAVEQHHMRTGNRGFPPRTGTTLVSRVADIVGISEEYARLMLKSRINPNVPIEGFMEREIFPGFPNEVVRAFLATFFPTNKNFNIRQ